MHKGFLRSSHIAQVIKELTMIHYLEVMVDNVMVKGFLLRAAVALFCNDLKSSIANGPNAELAVQIDHLFFPLQKIAGSEDHCSFVVYVLPRLDLEKRRLLEYQEHPDVKIDLSSGTVLLTIDGFNKIDGIHVVGIPEIYSSINKFADSLGEKSIASDSGNTHRG
jgi:hypothetical protein